VTLRLKVIDFWKGSERTINHFFVPLMERVFSERVELVDSKYPDVDIELISVFRDKSIKSRLVSKLLRNSLENNFESKHLKRQTKRIWFCGENKRPPLYRNFDAYLCFEKDGYANKVHYLPLWVLNLNWFGEPAHGFSSLSITQDMLLRPRHFETKLWQTREFCVAFIGNGENQRLSILEELRKLGKVSIFGRLNDTYIRDKMELLSAYKFSLCFENTLYPGYVTEKLLEAYGIGSVPLYWGLDSYGYFNKKSFLNLADYPNVALYIEAIKRISENQSLANSMMCQPLLRKPFDIELLINNLSKSLT
jgi:hypothetical protein